ncbi:MAG: hypothetical protein RIG62_23020 [Cyclobacteriaceae bacterium]
MASLQSQIDFIQKEHDRCKLVYDFLLREFGQKHIHHFDKEISEKIDFSRAIVKSLQNLQSIRNEKDH